MPTPSATRRASRRRASSASSPRPSRAAQPARSVATVPSDRTSIAVRPPTTLTTPTDEDLAFMNAAFPCRVLDYSARAVDRDAHARGPWRSRSRHRHDPIDDPLLRRHLAQEIALAAYARVEPDADGTRRCVTRHVCIDLDTSGDDTEDLRARMRRVVAALGDPTFVVSSPSGGAHVLYLLSAPARPFDLRAPRSRDGAVVRLLEAQGLALEAGRVEVYPAGRMIDEGENVCRLPFGVGSWLLDPVDLDPLAPGRQGVDALRWVRERLADGALPVVDAADWIAAADALPRPVPRRAAAAPSTSRLREAERHAAPFADGLREFGTRERATAAQAFLWQAQGVAEQDAVARIREWLPAHHNGKSRTWNRTRNTERLLREAEGTVRRVYRWCRAHGVVSARVAEPLQTRAESAALVAWVMDPARCVDPRTGRPLDPWRALTHGIALLRRTMQEVLTQVRDRPACKRDGRRGLLGRAWPDFADPTACVPIPHALRLKPVEHPDGTARPAVAKNAEAPYFRALTEGTDPILPRVHGHYAQGRMAAHFARRLDLEGERVIADAATALALLGGDEDAVRRRIGEARWASDVAAAFASVRAGTVRVAPDTAEVRKARAYWREATAAPAVPPAVPASLPPEREHGAARPYIAPDHPAEPSPMYAGRPLAEWARVAHLVVRIDSGAALGLVPGAPGMLEEIGRAAATIMRWELSDAAPEASFDVACTPDDLKHRIRVTLEEGARDALLERRLAAALRGHLDAVLCEAGRTLNLAGRGAAA